MQTKVTVISILTHKWHSCDFAHCIFVQYLHRPEQKMQILYIAKPPPLIIFILAHTDQVDMDLNFFLFFHTKVLMSSNYNNAITSICWYFHYHIKLKRRREKIHLVRKESMDIFFLAAINRKGLDES